MAPLSTRATEACGFWRRYARLRTPACEAEGNCALAQLSVRSGGRAAAAMVAPALLADSDKTRSRGPLEELDG